MGNMTAVEAFEAIYNRLNSVDGYGYYLEEAEIVRKALESVETLKASAKLIASL